MIIGRSCHHFSYFQCLPRSVWKGVLKILLAVVHGLEFSSANPGASAHALSSSSRRVARGMASAFGALELAHTHYYRTVAAAAVVAASAAAAEDRSAAVSQLTTSYVPPSGRQRPASVASTVRYDKLLYDKLLHVAQLAV